MMVKRIVTFVLIIYIKAWFQAPLPTSAARHDLEFFLKVIKFRKIEPAAAFLTLQSVRRHLWYMNGQMVTLALADNKLEAQEREELAKQIHCTMRTEIKSGRPDIVVCTGFMSQISVHHV